MMNSFSFDIVYKKGDEMPADFLSRNAVDAIQFNLNTYAREQNKDEILRHLRLYLLNKVLPENNKIAQLIYRMSQDCFVLDGSCLETPWSPASASFCPVGATTFDPRHSS
jgi:hypothetical protein